MRIPARALKPLAAMAIAAASFGCIAPAAYAENATAAVIVLSGFLVAGWQVGPGPSVDRAVTAVWAAVGQASTGSSDPAAAFGDFWVDHVMVPTYGVVHLGPSGDAADKYAERLWQAQSYTRAEEAAALSDPAVDADLVRRKKGRMEFIYPCLLCNI